MGGILLEGSIKIDLTSLASLQLRIFGIVWSWHRYVCADR